MVQMQKHDERMAGLLRALGHGVPDVVFGSAAQSFWRVGAGVAEERRVTSALDAWTLLNALASTGTCWLGGLAFDPRLQDGWEGFGAGRWVRPVTLWTQDGQRVEGPAGGHAGVGVPVRNRVVRTTEHRAPWDDAVQRALARFEQGPLEKVVLARAVDVELETVPDWQAVLVALAQRNPSAHVFFHRVGPDAAFVGATPETLCRVEGQTVTVDALAGSALPPGTFGPKEQHEHAVVVRDIRSRLVDACVNVKHPAEPGLRVLPTIQHLHTPITATLRDGAQAADVARALHPTPAVGGLPRPEALRFLLAHEKLQRGWYSGPVGVVEKGLLHLGVALRCALVKGRHARLFVGAGLVQGSDAQAEWDETGHKARVMLDALTGAS